MNDLVWVTMNLEDGNRLAYVGASRNIAYRVAAALVGNDAAADAGELVLYGPGDGTTGVMVSQIPKNWVGPATWDKLLEVCRLLLNDFHRGEDGFWRAGPFADPSTPEGEGGVIQLLREAVERG